MCSTVRYECRCVTGTPHVHECAADTARRRGAHAFLPAPAPAPGDEDGVFATSLRDALRGALLGALVGDALAAPTHWLYSRDAAQRLKAAAFGGELTGFARAPQAAAAAADPDLLHADSGKYFSRCDPAREPVRAIFGGEANERRWRDRGVSYHESLPLGDNTLTCRLMTLVASHVASRGGFDAQVYFAEYARLLTRQPAAPGGAVAAHDDLWVDEAHRVLFRNLARGARPFEAGMDDVCLTALALALPLVLAYAADRDAAELAVRCLLQLTHKHEDAVAQALGLGDLLAQLLAPHLPRAGAGEGYAPETPRGCGVQAALRSSFATFAEGRMDFDEVLARGLSDEDAYHGPRVLFSSR
jgi:hypothetical protein